jgi:hypothetical protein
VERINYIQLFINNLLAKLAYIDVFIHASRENMYTTFALFFVVGCFLVICPKALKYIFWICVVLFVLMGLF